MFVDYATISSHLVICIILVFECAPYYQPFYSSCTYNAIIVSIFCQHIFSRRKIRELL